MSRSPSHRAAAVLLAIYVAGIAIVLLAPSDALATWFTDNAAATARTVGVPEALLGPGRFELYANTLIFVPPALVATALWERRSWTDWTAYAFAVSASIEAVQALLLPGRAAEYVDVVANTAGALIGAVIGAVIRAIAKARDTES